LEDDQFLTGDYDHKRKSYDERSSDHYKDHYKNELSTSKAEELVKGILEED
jgi:hypothetical protein